jgi:hypothetical protein
MKPKIFFMGRRINGRFDSFKARAKRAFRKTLEGAAVVAVLALAFAFGGAFYSTSTVTVSADTVEAPSPILDRIADCESGNGTAGSATQFKHGQVLISINTNGTYDEGKFQINSIHNADATKLGYDLFTEQGNTAYAHYLYANKGTGDWASSAKCWAR